MEEFTSRFEQAMDDDFNTAVAIAALFELNHDLNRLLQNPSPHAPPILKKGKETFVLAGKVLGIFQEDPSVFLEQEHQRKTKTLTISPEEIEKLITERNEARHGKNWVRADEIRNHLASQGIILEDGPQGTTWRVN
jgi:cysteinyl-tRNA synthetase